MTDKIDKPVCHERRHMTPSQFMTYDAMRAMAEKPALKTDGRPNYGYIVCYARLTTITNHTSISRNTNRANIEALKEMGWLEEEPRSRWRGGRFGSNHYLVVSHEEYQRRALEHTPPYKRCPVFKFEAHTGKLLKSPRPADRTRNGVNTFCGRVPDNPGQATASSRPDTDGIQPTGHGTASGGLDDRVQPTGHKPCISP